MTRSKADQKSAHYKLLIVDDEYKICSLLAEHFSLRGFEVRTVNRGEEAVALIPVFHPDVVLLDLLMPGIDGVDTFKQIKEMPNPPRVLMVSAADHEEVVKGALDLGVDFYVCKPINLSDLDQMVERVCPAN